jgi:transcriptional regulator with XRE-family HTH domain
MALATVGERIKARRKELGLTLSSLAKRADLTPAAIWQYEQEERSPSSEALGAIAAALKVTTDYLLGARVWGWEDLLADKELRAMFRGLEKLSEDDKRKLVDYYRWLKSQQRRDKSG